MLTRIIVSASFVAFVATQAPAMLASGRVQQDVETIAISHNVSATVPNHAVLSADHDGHFGGQFIVNGSPLTAVIDTGATFVALDEATAGQAGIETGDLVYNHRVSTAGGDIMAARVMLARMQVGDVSLADVDALVVRNSVLPNALIGMSFLHRLSSYAVAGNEMKLMQ